MNWSRTWVIAVGMLVLWAAHANAAGMLKPGDPFPAWELEDHTGKRVSSRDLAGKVYLIWFYPKAMTPGCTVEGKGLRDHFDAFRDRGVEILGVSFDAPEANAAFVNQEGFPFRLLSDRNRALALAVGAAETAEQPVATRISYLVGRDGKVRKAYAGVVPATHAEAVLSDLAGETAAPKDKSR